MSAPAYGPDELLCHCGDDVDGHALGDRECLVAVKSGARLGMPRIPSHLTDAGEFTAAGLGARGTCPECSKPGVRVQRAEIRGVVHVGRKGPLLGVEPRIAPHKAEGTPCPGAGRVPAETRFTPSREIASWIAVHGTEALA